MDSPPEPPSPPRGVPPFTLAVIATVLTLPCYLLASGTQLLHLGFGLWFTEVLVFLGISWTLVRFSGRSPPRYTGIAAIDLRPLAYGFAVGVANFAAAVVPIQFVATSIVPESLRQRFDQARLFEAQSGIDLLVLVAGVGLAAPLCEEFFFRGVLQRGITRSGDQPDRGFGPLRAIVVTGLLFSIFHLDPVGLLARWELGVLFGWLAWRSRSIWPGVAAHAANNLVSTAVFFLAGGPEATEEDPSWKAVLALAAFGLPVLAGLLLAPARFTSLLTVRVPWTSALSGAPPRSLYRLGAPWVLAGAVGIAVVVALDWRGVQLNAIDVEHRLEPLPKDAPESEQMREGSLQAIRRKARRGELTLELYREKRKELSEARKRGEKAVALGDDPDSAGAFRSKEEALEIILPLPEGAKEGGPEAEAIRAQASKLADHLQASKAGQVDGVEVQARRVVIHAYGRDADDLVTAARAVLGGEAVKEGALRIRRGPPGTKWSEELL